MTIANQQDPFIVVEYIYIIVTLAILNMNHLTQLVNIAGNDHDDIYPI